MSHRITPPKLTDQRYCVTASDGNLHWWWCSRCRIYGPSFYTSAEATGDYRKNHRGYEKCIYDYGTQP